MTVITTANRKDYAGLLGQDTFAYDFRVDLKADMNVFVAGALQDPGDWSITELTNPLGGDVVLDTPLVANASVTLLRVVDLTQTVDYQPLDAFPSETHERALDKLTFMHQQLGIPGEFVPTIQDDSLSDAEGQVYGIQLGRYVQIGKTVWFWGRIGITNLGTLNGADRVKLAGLPFTAIASDVAGNMHVSELQSGNITAGETISGYVEDGTNYVQMEHWSSASGTNLFTVDELSVGGTFRFSGVYEIA